MRCSISSRIARYRARFTAGHGRGARRQAQPALPRRHIPTSRRWLRQLILLWSQVLPHRICLHLIPVRCRQPGHQVRRLRHLRMRPHFHRRQHRLANPADLPRNTPRRCQVHCPRRSRAPAQRLVRQAARVQARQPSPRVVPQRARRLVHQAARVQARHFITARLRRTFQLQRHRRNRPSRQAISRPECRQYHPNPRRILPTCRVVVLRLHRAGVQSLSRYRAKSLR